MTVDRVMLLIDADNVSVDVMDQAVRLLLKQHGGLHVRRAYCTAESAVKHQTVFKHLGIKPMVNLAAGKNSTDIALAVDAMDLVLAERPDVVVIASSDSDFAPLVHRLREKGCVVRGIGQSGKTGDETQGVYDDFTVLEHRKGTAEPDGKPARKTPARKAAAKTAPARKAAATKKAPATKTAAAKSPRKTGTRKTAASTASENPPPEEVEPPTAPPAVEEAPVPAASGAGRHALPGHAGKTTVQAVLACLPELASGQGMALNVAVQRLREAQLLGRNSSSLKLFSQLAEHFELTPADKPTQVRRRG